MFATRIRSAFLGCGTTMAGLAGLACGGDDDSTGPVLEPVATLMVTPAAATIAPGGSVQLHASVEDEAGTGPTAYVVTWSSSDEAVASVSESGLVSGISIGAAVVTATFGSKTGSATVTVRGSVESIELVPAAAEIAVSETLELVAITRDKDGDVVTAPQMAWTSSDDRVATVSQNGLVTGIGAGTARITAMTQGEKGSALITVAPVE
jgi:uncharacterized protein YjdB